MAQACDRIVGNLRKSGIYIDLVHFGQHRSIKIVQQQNGRLICIPSEDGPGHSLNCLYNLLQSPDYKTSYSIIVAFGGYFPLTALPVFKNWLKTDAVLMLRGNDFDLGIFSPARRQLLFDAFMAADSICLLSHDLKRKISPFVDNDKLELIYNGIDSNEWCADESDLEQAKAWRKSISDDGKLIIGLVGQFKAKKGGVFLLSNVLAANLHENFHFVVIGDIAEGMQNWLEQYQDQLQITKMPFMDHLELLRYYPACDFIALPSFYDGMPNVLLEAGALGVPVIAARAGGITDVLGENEIFAPFLFHPGDRHGCRKALWQAASSTREQRLEIGQALCKHIRHSFSAETETSKYRQLLLKLFNRSSIGFMKP